jgi:heat shock protein HslJ
MIRRAAAIAGILGLVCGCGGPPPARLDGDWLLERGVLDGRPLPMAAGSRITMTIDGKKIGGVSACNTYAGTIERDGDEIRISALTATEMACDEPVMASEAAYVRALAAATAAARDDGRLVLSGPSVELRYSLLPAMPAADLVGTIWILDSLIAGDTVSSVAGKRATLELRAGGTLSGSTGCRSFTGSYQITGDEVRVTGLRPESWTCPEALKTQDAHVLGVIADGFTVAIDGDRLTVSDGPAGLGYLADGF